MAKLKIFQTLLDTQLQLDLSVKNVMLKSKRLGVQQLRVETPQEPRVESAVLNQTYAKLPMLGVMSGMQLMELVVNSKGVYQEIGTLRSMQRDTIIARTQNRRSEVASRGTVTANEWSSILQKFNYSCAYCGATGALTMDHVLAIHNGGTNTVHNIVPACKRCNSSKGTQEVSSWYSQQSFYTEEQLNKVLNHLKGGI